MTESNILICEVEVHDPRLRRHIARGWIGGMSMSGRGCLTFVSNYPWWYRALLHVKRWVWKRWHALFGRRAIDGFQFNPKDGTLVFSDAIPRPGATIVTAYKVNQATLDLMEWEKRNKQ